MYRGLSLLVLLPWLGITTIVEATHHSITLFDLRPGAIFNTSKDANRIYQVCTPNWDFDDRVVCYHRYYQSLLFLGHKNNRNGWSVYCDNDEQIQRQCYVTPPDSASCVHHDYSYVGHICDLTRFIQPQDDALSNQTNEPDINREALKYLAISIFLGAFLFPVLLGICCFYWSNEDDCRDDEEGVQNHALNLEHSISVVGRNPSANSVTESDPEDIPPSYEACNDAIQEEEEEM